MYRSLLLLGFALAMAGCAGLPQSGGGSANESWAAMAPPRDPEADLIYQVLAGEMAGQMGDLEQSVGFYLQAARLSEDPQVAERATRIAVYANLPQAALEAAQRWVVLAPDNLDAQQTVGLLYVRNHQPEAAVPHFETVIEKTRDVQGGGFVLVGALLARDADPEQAMETLHRLVELHPEDPAGHYTLANVALQAGDYSAAMAGAERALALDPTMTDAKVVRARAMLGEGQVEPALAEMTALLREHPRNTDLRLAYARMLVQAKRYDKAMAEFERVVTARPGDADLLYTVSLLAIELDRYGAAEKYLLRLLDTGRHTNEAHYYLGRVAEHRHDYKMAIAWYVKVVDGEFALDAQVRVSVMLAKLGHLDKAREHLGQLREQVDDAQTRVRLYLAEGQLLRDQHQDQEAWDLYSRALLLYPGQPDLLYARALTAESLDRVDLLEADLHTVLEHDPENASALNALGYTLADRTDRYQEALGYITRAYELRPDDPAILDSMGWVQFRLGNYAEAEQYLRTAYEQFPDGEVAAHLVELLWATDRQAEARKLYKSAHAKDPDNQVLDEVKGRLGL